MSKSSEHIGLIFRQLKSVDEDDFEVSWMLYCNAFPVDERRQLDVQSVIMQQSRYRYEVVYSGSIFVGILLWWQFDNSVYLEHLATTEGMRGKGVGRAMIKQFLQGLAQKVILEVELPNSPLNRRRIAFYERLGFVLNEYEYQQMPMRRGGAEVDLMLMTYPGTIKEVDVVDFKKEYERNCFSPVANYI
ncbi:MULTISPECIES: GNAT family N-acetyltransferase [unclassified Carboxylicivirga]|uniref:GNAT family N-acetyltransferase n=1 Tax=Carboxylicivirga TaxID=1628153 RepID=UPI003D341D38